MKQFNATIDVLAKNKLNSQIQSFIHMNESSINYLDNLVEKHKQTLTKEEIENLSNLNKYLDSLTVFYKNLIPK